MQKIIYEAVKTILEETPFVSFEVDDEAMTFTCNKIIKIVRFPVLKV